MLKNIDLNYRKKSLKNIENQVELIKICKNYIYDKAMKNRRKLTYVDYEKNC